MILRDCFWSAHGKCFIHSLQSLHTWIPLSTDRMKTSDAVLRGAHTSGLWPHYQLLQVGFGICRTKVFSPQMVSAPQSLVTLSLSHNSSSSSYCARKRAGQRTTPEAAGRGWTGCVPFAASVQIQSRHGREWGVSEKMSLALLDTCLSGFHQSYLFSLKKKNSQYT